MRKSRMLFILCLALLGATLVGQPANAADPQQANRGKIVVANRGDGTLSIINVRTDEVMQTRCAC